MTDNIAVTAGTGTTIAADDIGAGILAQRVKPVWGPDGTGNDIDIASGKPLPVQLRSSTGTELVISALGQAAMAASAPVVIASDQTKLIVHGDTAAAATDANNPVKIGGVGKTTNPTAVTDGQRVNATFDKLGKLIAVGAIRDLKGVTQTQISASTSETTIVAAVASTFLDLYGLILANTGASTTKVTIKDATSGTTRAIIEVPTLETRGFMLPVDSAIPQAAVNNNWTATCGTSTTALEVTALWVKNL